MAGISGINNNNSLYNLSLFSNQSSTSTSEIGSSSSSVAADSITGNSANSIIFSPEGQIYNRLQKLQKSDPDKFKKVCSRIASELTATAKKNGGTGAAELAAKFTGAAESGEMTDLTATTTATTKSTSTSATDKISKAKSILNQYYQQYAANQSTGSSDISSMLQSILDGLNTSV